MKRGNNISKLLGALAVSFSQRWQRLGVRYTSGGSLLLHGLTLHLALLHLLGNPALGALHLLLDTSWQDRDGIGATSTTSSPVVGSLLYEGSHETWVGLEYLEDLLLLLRRLG